MEEQNISGSVPFKCPGCKSQGFEPSAMKDRCTFCDGTENGEPPSAQEVEEWNSRKEKA